MKGLYLSIILIVVLAIFLFNYDRPTRESVATKPEAVSDTFAVDKSSMERDLSYQILSADTNEFKNIVYLDVLIKTKLTVEELISIAYKERQQRGALAHVQIGFHYYSANNPYYGQACYFYDCSNCQQKDKDGEPISANISYVEQDEPQTLNKLPKSIQPTDIAARYHDHVLGGNNLIAYTNAAKTKASHFRLHKVKDYEEKLQAIGNGDFRVVETGATYRVSSDRVEYIHTNGAVAYTYERYQ